MFSFTWKGDKVPFAGLWALMFCPPHCPDFVVEVLWALYLDYWLFHCQYHFSFCFSIIYLFMGVWVHTLKWTFFHSALLFSLGVSISSLSIPISSLGISIFFGCIYIFFELFEHFYSYFFESLECFCKWFSMGSLTWDWLFLEETHCLLSICICVCLCMWVCVCMCVYVFMYVSVYIVFISCRNLYKVLICTNVVSLLAESSFLPLSSSLPSSFLLFFLFLLFSISLLCMETFSLFRRGLNHSRVWVFSLCDAA